jgi:ABC-2 type transport system ATP-binding protein
LLSSHIVSDLEKVCDYITFIHNGKVVLTEEKDILMDEYVVVKGTESEIRSLPVNAVVGMKQNKFGAEALVKKRKISGNYTFDKATLEDIMLFVIKGEKLC